MTAVTHRAIVIRVPAGAASQFSSMALATVSALLILFIVQLAGISQLQWGMSQSSLYQELRLSLAEGSTPVAPADAHDRLVPLGTPVAAMTFASLGMSNQVVVEGTGSGQTMLGIGHRRDTVLPCQVGSSVLMARAGAYGAVGSRWKFLRPGQRFTVTMGLGHCTYEVMDHRHVGDVAPPAPTGREGRLVLTTASGLPFMPTEVDRIDARLVTPAFDRPSAGLQQGSLPNSELAMGVDAGQMPALILLLEGLALVVAGGTWLWRRWGKWQAWIVATPPALALGLLTVENLTYLLPNLL